MSREEKVCSLNENVIYFFHFYKYNIIIALMPVRDRSYENLVQYLFGVMIALFIGNILLKLLGHLVALANSA